MTCFLNKIEMHYRIHADYALNKLLPSHPLFHGTSAVVSIVSHGEGIRSGKGSRFGRGNYKAISVTRDLEWLLSKQGAFGNAILVLDRDEIKTKFKIKPIDAFGYMSDFKYRKEEREERIETDHIPVKYIKVVILLTVHGKGAEFTDPTLWPQSIRYIHYIGKNKFKVLNPD